MNDDKLTKLEQKEYRIKLSEIKNQYILDPKRLELEANKIRDAIIKKRTNSTSSTEEKKIIEIITKVPIIAKDDLIPFPNYLAKTALFSPRKKNSLTNDTGDEWVMLSSPPHYQIYYNGPYLTMEEQLLYMLLIKRAEGAVAGESIIISRYRILKDLGYKSLSNKAYEWLHKAMNNLIQSNIKIKLNKQVIELANAKISEITMHLIDEFAYDGENYIFKINNNSLILYSNNNYAYNSLNTKMAIKDKSKPEFTSWLYSFILSESVGIHRYKIDTIYEYIGSKKKRADFVKDLVNSLEVIQGLEIIEKYKIENNNYITWER